MKVLVATSRLQGKRPSDEFDCVEGELVWMVPICPHGRTDRRCDCRSRFGGLRTGRATTTAAVVDKPAFTREEFAEEFWSIHGSECACPVSEGDIDRLLAEASRWPVGAVLERNGRRLSLRGFAG
jgi:hypothetical protein